MDTHYSRLTRVSHQPTVLRCQSCWCQHENPNHEKRPTTVVNSCCISQQLTLLHNANSTGTVVDAYRCSVCARAHTSTRGLVQRTNTRHTVSEMVTQQGFVRRDFVRSFSSGTWGREPTLPNTVIRKGPMVLLREDIVLLAAHGGRLKCAAHYNRG